MQIHIKFAETAAETDALFKLRHQVFAEEMAVYLPRPDGRLYDRYDTYATTNNIIAVDRTRVIGTIRLTSWSEAGMPAEEFFDIGPHVPEMRQVCCASMLCLEPEYRGRNNLASLLLGTVCRRADMLGLSHVFTATNPVIERLLAQIGFQRLGATKVDPKTQLPYIPMRLALAEFRDWFRDFAQQTENGLRSSIFGTKAEALAA